MLPNFLKPFHIDNQKLVRVGPKLDGGYVIDKKSILNTSFEYCFKWDTYVWMYRVTE